MLPFDSRPAASLSEELDGWRRRLDHRGPLARSWAGRLRRELEAEAVAASTAMEGVPVTVDEVRRILAGVPVPEVHDEDRLLVEGYRDAMSFVLRRADDPSFRWNEELVIGLHDRVLAGRRQSGAGRLRTETTAYVIDSASGQVLFEPADPERVAPLVAGACESIRNLDAHPAIASAWIHVAIAAIHPFRDGNGRVARVLASLAMYRGGFRRPEFTSLEEWWGRHRTDYYAAFACLGARFDPDADVTPFVTAHVEAQVRQVRALDAREQVERRIWAAVEEVAQAHSLHVRVANALWDLFFGRAVTAGYYRALAEVSPATATNDLAAAVSAGLLEAHGVRRGRRYEAGEELVPEVGRTLRVEPLPAVRNEARARIVTELAARVASGE